MQNLWERAVVLSLEPFINPDSIILDCGANIGGVSQSLKHWLDKDGLIISVEPNSMLLPEIHKHLSEGNGRYLVISKAAHDKSGLFLDFYVENSYYATGSSLLRRDADSRKIVVETVALDDILEADSRNLSVIKIDTEGAELQVLKGAYKLIGKYKPVICFEVTSNDFGPIEFLTSFGYEFYFANSFEKFDAQKFVSDYGVWNILAVPTNLDFKIERNIESHNSENLEFLLSEGRYVFKVLLDADSNCLNSIGLKNAVSKEWLINFETKMIHLKHFTNSTLPVEIFEPTKVLVLLGKNCGHNHILSVSLEKISISVNGVDKTLSKPQHPGTLRKRLFSKFRNI